MMKEERETPEIRRLRKVFDNIIEHYKEFKYLSRTEFKEIVYNTIKEDQKKNEEK